MTPTYVFLDPDGTSGLGLLVIVHAKTGSSTGTNVMAICAR